MICHVIFQTNPICCRVTILRIYRLRSSRFLCRFRTRWTRTVGFLQSVKGRKVENFRKIRKKTLVSESLFWKSCKSEAYNFIKKRLQHRCFPMNIAKFSWRPFLQNTSGGCFFRLRFLSCSTSVSISLTGQTTYNIDIFF